MQLAQSLQYEPDAVAQSMRTRSTSVVGLLVSDLSNPLYAPIINAVEARLQRNGYSLLLEQQFGGDRTDGIEVPFERGNHRREQLRQIGVTDTDHGLRPDERSEL